MFCCGVKLNRLWPWCTSLTYHPVVYKLESGENKSDTKPPPCITSSSEDETRQISELFSKDRHRDWMWLFKMKAKRCNSFSCLSCDGIWCCQYSRNRRKKQQDLFVYTVTLYYSVPPSTSNFTVYLQGFHYVSKGSMLRFLDINPHKFTMFLLCGSVRLFFSQLQFS